MLLPAQNSKAILTETQNLRTEFEEYRARSAEDQAFDHRRIASLERGKSNLHRRIEPKC
jgi:hypothetical protein